MFQEKNQFGWVGFGYVRDIIRHPDYLLCCITVVQPFTEGSKRPDEIHLLCKIEDKALLRLFLQLECDFHLGHAILLEFVAEYINFESAQFDQDSYYQNHLLTFKAKLIAAKCFVNGHKYQLVEDCLAKSAA